MKTIDEFYEAYLEDDFYWDDEHDYYVFQSDWDDEDALYYEDWEGLEEEDE